MNITEEYNRWLQHTTDNEAIHQELLAMQEDQKLLEDAFYCDLVFGTAGLRGVMGAGTNRMNSYIVARASQGVANYLKQNHMQPAVVIGYDSRINSRSFAEITAEVLLATVSRYIFGLSSCLCRRCPLRRAILRLRQASCSQPLIIRHNIMAISIWRRWLPNYHRSGRQYSDRN